MRTKQEILQIIEEEDVEFIRLQFTDVLGNLKNIAITPGQMEKVIDGYVCDTAMETPAGKSRQNCL